MQVSEAGDTHPSRAVSKPCTFCRQRKVKCDRGQPCAACVRFVKDCTYDEHLTVSRPETLGEASHASAASASSPSHEIRLGREEKISTDAGSFVDHSGHSAYFRAGYWVTLFEETDELKALLAPSQRLASASFPISGDLDQVYLTQPSTEQSDALCELFFTGIEPLIRVVHEPSYRRERRKLSAGRINEAAEMKALTCGMYAVTVLLCSNSVIQQTLGQPRMHILNEYQLAVEKALVQCNFMASRSLIAFQALLYYITFLLASARTESAAGLISIACHVGRRCGFHKNVNLTTAQMSPFVVDMRGRAWCYLRYLDLRCCEADGHESNMPDEESMYPLNVEDASWEAWLHTQRSQTPASVQIYTDTTFAILRAKGEELKHSLLSRIATVTSEEADAKLVRFLQDVEECLPILSEYDHVSQSSPMQQLTTTYIRLQFEEIRLAIDIGHVKYGRKVGDAIKNDIFVRATHVLCGMTHLERSSEAYGWAWYFQRSPPFFAAAAILCHIMHRPEHFSDAAKIEAWQELERFFARHTTVSEDGFGGESKAWKVLRIWRELALINLDGILLEGHQDVHIQPRT